MSFLAASGSINSAVGLGVVGAALSPVASVASRLQNNQPRKRVVVKKKRVVKKRAVKRRAPKRKTKKRSKSKSRRRRR